ncbi:hypothetical protein [Streptomyces sp. NPDC096311]|uniref:hypothetical protein n=1 Tax=Streptomyces sp. NPDC096311 TaxID=3366083 RepID=UPI00382E7CDF
MPRTPYRPVAAEGTLRPLPRVRAVSVPGWWRWLVRQPEAPVSLRRTVWAALAALDGFSLLRYGFERPVMALYALFGTLPLAQFSKIPGRGWRRSRILLAALPTGLVLVAAGTMLAAQSWSAAVGMFVLAFTVSFLGVGGPGVGESGPAAWRRPPPSPRRAAGTVSCPRSPCWPNGPLDTIQDLLNCWTGTCTTCHRPLPTTSTTSQNPRARAT